MDNHDGFNIYIFYTVYKIILQYMVYFHSRVQSITELYSNATAVNNYDEYSTHDPIHSH